MSMVEEQAQTSAAGGSSSLLEEIMAQARITPVDEGYNVAKQGIAALVANILDSGNAAEPVNKALVDSMIVELDKKTQQTNRRDSACSGATGTGILLAFTEAVD
ncbi:hypothetical protein DZS_39820 [Dickeya ananatis]